MRSGRPLGHPVVFSSPRPLRKGRLSPRHSLERLGSFFARGRGCCVESSAVTLRSLLCATWIAGFLASSLAGAASTPENWTVSLVWSPEFCKLNPAAHEPQCVRSHYFEVSGLAPGFEPGADRHCTPEGLPPELLERGMNTVPNKDMLKDIWREQGACSGLEPAEYLVQMDRASWLLTIPDEYRELVGKRHKTTLAELKRAFSNANEGLDTDQISARCNGPWLYEVRVCVAIDFSFRRCGIEVEDQCRDSILLRPSR